MMAKMITRGLLANRTVCNIETIRYYEKTGLMPDPPRSAGGFRQYDENHERRLLFVMRGRELGFAIKDLKACLILLTGGQSHAQR